MKNGKIKPIVKAVICLVILGIVTGVGFGTGLFDSFKEFFKSFKLDGLTLLKVLMMVLLVLAVTNLVVFILGLIKPKNHRAATLLTMVASAMKYIAAIVIICWGLSLLGADVGTTVASLGILALVIGFGAESLIADLVTGVFMLFENQYNVGDYIEVAGFRGRVTEIGIRTTCIEDPGGNVKIINNSAMTNLLNRSSHTSRAVSTIGIPYATDLEELEKKIPAMMEGIRERHSDIMIQAPVYLGVDELGNSSVNLKFVVEVDDKDIYSAARQLNRELFLEFRKAGVEVPFPQVDVHQKP
ncbi:MAG: mechanosensitive ion channel family protein [Lachnospiraceae bacterium]|nr:mechanosensitive ion channel family protein [Lachnospiraceae bacterium]